MLILAQITLPTLALHSFTLSGVLLATLGTLFLAYDLLGRENGPLRWFTLVLTCGLLSALIFVPVATFIQLLSNSVDFMAILIYLLAGVLMGFYTVIIVELPSSASKPPPLFLERGAAFRRGEVDQDDRVKSHQSAEQDEGQDDTYKNIESALETTE